MKEIELTQGKIALVDDEDFEEFNQFKWYAHKDGNTFYATRHKNKKTIQMHRVIMSTPKGMETDHIDGNGLNNCKSNLRIVTHRQNAQNRHVNKSSVFAGVSWNGSLRKWGAQIQINGTSRSLGHFKTELGAHEAYLNALSTIGETLLINTETY